MIIFIIDWQSFQRYMNQNTVYVKEDDDHWQCYTYEGEACVKCIVKKEEESEKNIMFVERNFNGRTNIVKVVDIEYPARDKEKIEEVAVPELSDESVRDEDKERFEDYEESLEGVEDDIRE